MFWSGHTATKQAVPRRQAMGLQERTLQIGRDLLAETRSHRSSMVSKRFWSDRLVAWALKNPAFKTQLFRFIDVFPVLRTSESIHQHLLEYLQQPGVKLPAGLSLGITAGGLLTGTLAGTISSQIQAMAANFIAGADLNDAIPVLQARWREGIAFSLDLLGEACVSQAEAEAYRARYAELLQRLPQLTGSWPASAVLESDHLGAIPRTSISVKISALDGHVSPTDMAGSIDRLYASVRPLLELARQNDVMVYFDMEQHSVKELTFALFRRCCERIDFPAGIALQAYLRSADQDAQDLIEWSRSLHRTVWVRLIKGAYWDYETIHAELMGWPSPVWRQKAQTDACFERLTELFVSRTPRTPGDSGVRLALGTHNVRSIAHALACVEASDLPTSAIEFQALRGMAEELKHALVARDCRVREYVPIGQMIPGMAYLVRRLLENTSNEGFVRNSVSGDVADDQLLAAPAAAATQDFPTCQTFMNEPHRDFADARQREAFAHAITSVQLPPRPTEHAVQDVAETVRIATDACARWRDRPAQQRCDILRKAAAILRSRRDTLSGIMIHEANKTWAEADADICEAIDFCEFYAREAIRLFTPQPQGDYLGEDNAIIHEPRGVAVVISPWNFPLAICAGMTTAALVTGNTVIVKPAEQTPIIAQQLCEALWEAGAPRDVLQFLPGQGERVGASLVRDPRVALIAFTGSSAVGLDILRASAASLADASTGMPLKHVVCEMGGKNAIIVDSSGDMDEAVLGVRASAFSYAGQKCSACSRVIVLDDIHDNFVSRLVESTRALIVGDALDPATDVAPVIDEEAAAKIYSYIAIGKQEATLAYPERESFAPSSMISPHVFTNVPPASRIATTEIFGPVLCILRAKTFDEALHLANSVRYKLTGGVFSRTPSHLQQARKEFLVGNLYLNRGITGALVGRQPFGGFGLSGLGTQAGGPDYLLHFVHPRAIAENTLRRGFVPGRPRP